MSAWTHALCRNCYATLEPNRVPTVLQEPEEEDCCACGYLTQAGIYYRADPKKMRCQGKMGTHLPHLPKQGSTTCEINVSNLVGFGQPVWPMVRPCGKPVTGWYFFETGDPIPACEEHRNDQVTL